MVTLLVTREYLWIIATERHQLLKLRGLHLLKSSLWQLHLVLGDVVRVDLVLLVARSLLVA